MRRSPPGVDRVGKATAAHGNQGRPRTGRTGDERARPPYSREKETTDVTTMQAPAVRRSDVADDRAWRPLILDPSAPDDARQLALLRHSDLVWRTADTLDQQIHDLAE